MPPELPIVVVAIGLVGKYINLVGYDKMKLHNAHCLMLVAVVLKPFHALPEEQRPFRTAAMLNSKKGFSDLLTDRRTDTHCWSEDDVD